MNKGLFALVLCGSLLFWWALTGAAPAPEEQTEGATSSLPASSPAGRADLASQDCVKCHRWETWILANRGGKHNAKLTCTDCHQRHPPATWDVIPECGMCHIGEPHFAIEGCLTCHADPHAPMELEIDRRTTEPCVSCHASPGRQLREFESFHSTIHCTFCHYRHGFVPVCTDCHKPHTENEAGNNCSLCHQAHKPLMVQYGDEETVAVTCAGCHKAVDTLLRESGTKHAELACNFCHVDKHKTIPACQDCHGTPHPPAMMEKFPRCGQCHNIAHDLHL